MNLLSAAMCAQLDLSQTCTGLIVLGALGNQLGIVRTHVIERALHLFQTALERLKLLLCLLSLILCLTHLRLERNNGLLLGLLFLQHAVTVGDERLCGAIGFVLFLQDACTLLLGLIQFFFECTAAVGFNLDKVEHVFPPEPKGCCAKTHFRLAHNVSFSA